MSEIGLQLICMQMYIFAYDLTPKMVAIIGTILNSLHHSSDSSSLILLSISFLRFIRILVIAAFSLPSC